MCLLAGMRLAKFWAAAYRHEFTVQERDCKAQPGAPLRDDGMPRTEEEHRVENEEPHGIKGDGQPGDGLDCPPLRVGCICALDAHIHNQPTLETLVKVVARECLERHIRHHRVHEEEEPCHQWQRLIYQGAMRVAAPP